MERRFKVLDGDGEVIRTFLTKADAIKFMEMRLSLRSTLYRLNRSRIYLMNLENVCYEDDT